MMPKRTGIARHHDGDASLPASMQFKGAMVSNSTCRPQRLSTADELTWADRPKEALTCDDSAFFGAPSWDAESEPEHVGSGHEVGFGGWLHGDRDG